VKKYDKIKRLGHPKTEEVLENSDDELVIVEKFDGNNFRVQLNEDNQLIYGSRNVKFTENGDPLPPEECNNQFVDVAEYVRENIDNEKLKELEEQENQKLVLFGENMVKHHLEYDWEDAPQWILFDVYKVAEEEYMDYSEVKAVAAHLGVEACPVDNRIHVENFKDGWNPDKPDSIVPRSKYRDGLAEGVIIRNEETKTKAKIVTEEFKEKHRQSGGNHGEESLPDDDTMSFVNIYATDARVRKHIKKLTVDEDKDLEMALMEELPMRVVEDIFEEEMEEIVRTSKSIQFKRFRSKVADKCVKLLRAEISKNAVKGGSSE